MKRWIESIVLVLAFCMAFITSQAAAIDKPRVQDDAKFFSPDTIKNADALIAKIKSTYGRDVYVETWPGVPEDQKAKLKEMGEDDYFGEAVFRRANALKMTDGIIIVICRDPSYLRIGVGPELKQLEFVTSDRDKLRTLMLDKFRGKKFDEGLLDGLKLIDATLKEAPDRQAKLRREQAAERAAAAASGRAQNVAGTAAAGAMAPASTEPYDPSKPVPEMPGPDRSHLFTGRNLVLVGVGLFVLYLLVRALLGGMRRSRQQTMAYGPPAGGMGAAGMGGGGGPRDYAGGNYPQAGGGAGRGFLGGLLGGVLGGAAYDHLSRGRGGEGATGNIGSHSETYIPPQMNPGPDAPRGDAFDLPPDGGGDAGGFESSGGSFGDSSSSETGSSDAGGGFDSSGGSFDSGGGGGDFGGGGDAGGGGDF